MIRRALGCLAAVALACFLPAAASGASRASGHGAEASRARAPGAGTGWRSVAPGLEFRTIDGTGVCRRGSPLVAVVRLRPERWRIDLFHYLGAPAGGPSAAGSAADPNRAAPMDVEEWQRRTGAAVVFNAGQYYPDRTPMGLFVKQGRNLGSKQLKDWKGLLVAEPRGTGRRPRAGILDLEHDTFSLPASPYGIVLQSFMLLDRDGDKRVRRSDWHANRTAVAVDRRGRILILHTEGAWTLWELADWIQHASRLGVRQAMSLDGGFESQLCLHAGGADYLSFGRWHVDDRGDHSLPGARAKLPAVVAVFPRK
jgi:uncharacterized protein YigE (DUF2233 family)